MRKNRGEVIGAAPIRGSMMRQEALRKDRIWSPRVVSAPCPVTLRAKAGVDRLDLVLEEDSDDERIQHQGFDQGQADNHRNKHLVRSAWISRNAFKG